ncbi:MBL fold metallo-hydrolase [Dehalococcoides mccartyi]|uniref:MBL fold metallo-hydrolase n=5 Tax=root TaxID=1 RepID=A0AB33HT45_9CHLR|nr:MBL fold metallo-hydrolase [Dehalococcoides mccartyi]
MAINLTFYGGVGEIGGNKILLEADGTRIFLDFGTSFSSEDEYFEFPLLRPSCIEDLFKTGILPKLQGLYKNAGLSVNYASDGTPSLCGDEEVCSIDGILLSHAHVDHYGYLGMLRPDIPIYLSPISRKIIELKNDIREDWQTRVNLDTLCPVEKAKDFEIESLKITRYDVDHSVLGASAFIINAGDKTIAYTGDMRFHGNAVADSEEFLSACRSAGIDTLLCEGTRLGPPSEDEKEVESHALSSESEVEQKCRDIFSNEDRLIIYDASPADMNRMRLISKVAQDFGRTLVLDSKKAYLSLYMNYPDILCPGLPATGEFKIALSRLKLNASRYGKYGLPQDLYAESYIDYRQAHEGKLLVAQRDKQKDNPDLICMPDESFIWGPLREEILRDPGSYLLYTSSGAHTLLHFLPADGRSVPGTYIYGKAEPFKEEMELSFRRLMKWIELCELKLEYAHTSGHMYQQDIERLVSEIDAKLVIPIHTEHPELFKNWVSEIRVPHTGESIKQ